MLPIQVIHSVTGQCSSGRHLTASIPSATCDYPTLPSGDAAQALLTRAVQVLRHASVADTSRATYNVGFRQFCIFLAVSKLTLSGLELPDLMALICTFAAYSFFFRGLQPSTIRSYIQGVDHHLKMANLIPRTLWHPTLNQVLLGIDRETSFESALINKSKLPFSLPLILFARSKVLMNTVTFELYAVFAALFWFYVLVSEV